MSPIRKKIFLQKNLLIHILMCAVMSLTFIEARAQIGSNGHDANEPEGLVSVTVNAHQCGSADLAMMWVENQIWFPSAAKDGCQQGAAGTHTFHLKPGFCGPLTVYPIEAIDPDDGTVSLWWNVWSDDLALVDGGTGTSSAGGGNISPQSHNIDVPEPIIHIPRGSLSGAPLSEESWIASSPYHFDFQGVVQGTPGMYSLAIQGDITSLSPLQYKWTLEAAAGLLTDDSIASPGHIAPDNAGTGVLTLQASNGAIASSYNDTRTIKIYQDHLARDYENFGTGVPCADQSLPNWAWTFTFQSVTITMPYGWNCHGSTRHHYDGTLEGSIDGGDMAAWLSAFTPRNELLVDHQIGGGSHSALGSLDRGDIIAYYNSQGTLIHTQTCTGNGTETYGANNEPLSYPGTPAEQSWIWATSPAGDWANNMYWPDWPNEMKAAFQWTDPTPVTIKVYSKP